ncbi:MAG: transposase family protein [Verrucomicrobia bacterium]|nr:transposase family protein [Verrucomicrobiota bacterium]
MPSAAVLIGPTKAFECPLANQLWMADVSHGPTIRLPSGQIIRTRLIATLDDCSRLVPHAQYYPDETLCCFLDTFKQALAKRGIPDKLYTDNGKIFTSHHLRIVCANLNIKLIHAKPYPAWSKGKMERWFRTVQSDFEAQLLLNHLAMRSIQQAIEQNCQTISSAHLQQALELLPWLAQLHQSP